MSDYSYSAVTFLRLYWRYTYIFLQTILLVSTWVHRKLSEYVLYKYYYSFSFRTPMSGPSKQNILLYVA